MRCHVREESHLLVCWLCTWDANSWAHLFPHPSVHLVNRWGGDAIFSKIRLGCSLCERGAVLREGAPPRLGWHTEGDPPFRGRVTARPWHGEAIRKATTGKRRLLRAGMLESHVRVCRLRLPSRARAAETLAHVGRARRVTHGMAPGRPRLLSGRSPHLSLLFSVLPVNGTGDAGLRPRESELPPQGRRGENFTTSGKKTGGVWEGVESEMES